MVRFIGKKIAYLNGGKAAQSSAEANYFNNELRVTKLALFLQYQQEASRHMLAMGLSLSFSMQMSIGRNRLVRVDSGDHINASFRGNKIVG